MAQKRIKTHVLETIISTLMIVFGITAAWIFFTAMGKESMGTQMAMIEILLIIILAILAQTVILIRVYEQNLLLMKKK